MSAITNVTITTRASATATTVAHATIRPQWKSDRDWATRVLAGRIGDAKASLRNRLQAIAEAVTHRVTSDPRIQRAVSGLRPSRGKVVHPQIREAIAQFDQVRIARSRLN